MKELINGKILKNHSLHLEISINSSIRNRTEFVCSDEEKQKLIKPQKTEKTICHRECDGNASISLWEHKALTLELMRMSVVID